MGINWSKITGLFTSIAPILAPVAGGPVGAILKAISSSVVIIENYVTNKGSQEKRQRAIDMVGSLLTVGEEAAAKDLASDPLVASAVGSVIDAEVALRNAHAHLAVLVEDIQQKRKASESET